jgi:3-methyl-2-oxobutanoate hydroxymethyltransferase
MRSNRPTVADLRAMKGKRQLSKIRVFTMEEVEAAARAFRAASIPSLR